MKKKRLQITNLEVKVPSKVSTRSNGIKKLVDKTSRTFESRMVPRYRQMPPLPENLHQPQFSESSEKILKERYLLKGGDLGSGETIAERFWHVSYDLASAGFDFGENKTQVYQKALKFYDLMVSQSFEPNSPTLMNSGKQNGLQYSACFVLPVEDSLTGIFDTIKYAALIHQSGGGCISSDARVWTTFCGIEPIEVLVSRAISDGRMGERQGRGIAYDVSDLNIRTVAMNPQTAEIGLKEVTHVWQFDVPASQQMSIITHQGTQVQTSLWHPFMVLRGTKLIETRADQLTAGDIILGPDKAGSYWPWRSLRKVGSLVINEDLAWLIGFTLGDGSFGYVNKLRQYRVRWFSGTEDVLLKVQNILLKHGIKVSIQKDKRNLLSICTLNQRFVHDLLEACGLEKFGPKDDFIKVPEIIAKSPLCVVKAFLAGLIDSDGYVAADGSPSYSSVSEAMAQDLAALVSLLGFYPSVKSKNPYGKGRRKTYSVQLCTLPQVNNLADDLRPYLANNLRLLRLKSASRRQTALPLGFKPWRDLLFDLGLVKKRFEREGPGPISRELNYWSSHGRIDRDSILSIAEYVRPRDKKSADFLKRIALSGQEIKEVKGVQTPKKFYDLSVKDWNTYAAGSSGLVMIHNTGFAFSRLRPRGSRVKSTGGVASGPVSFLRVFDAATKSIKQGGTRRGANMGILRIDHPDILEFIRCKAELDDDNKIVYDAVSPSLPDDGARANFKTRLLDTQIANFNISVAVTDKFMQAYYSGTDYDLIDPLSGEVVGKLNAREVFSEIVDRAWSTGDPGMVFIDRINHSPANPIQDLEVIEATNPCVTGDTLVATDAGWKRADKIKIADRIGTVLGSGLVDKIEVHENFPVYRVKFSDGAEVRVTGAHQFHAIVREDRAKNSANKKFAPIRLDQLKVGDMVRVAPAIMPDNPVADLPNGWNEKDYGFFLGVLLGDGCITETSLKRNVVKVAVDTSEKQWNEIIRNILKKAGSKVVNFDVHDGLSANMTVQNSGGAALLVKNSYLKPAYSYEKKIPLEYQQTNREFLTGLLDGLFSTDGNVNLTSTHPFLRLKTTSWQLALDIRRILLYFGIHGRVVTIRKVSDSKVGERVIRAKHQQYEVIISGASMKSFTQQISLSHPIKQQRLREAQLKFALTGNTWLTQIVSIEPAGLEKVYDLYESVSDTWNTEGIISRGCGEQPLAPWDACNLGSINLGKFVKDTEVDWERLRQVTSLAVEFLDDVVQTNPYSLRQIYDEVHDNRRIGLGVMGWADMLFKLKVPYDSEEALQLAEDVMAFINKVGHETSEILAKERGAFPNWPYSIYKNSKPIRNSTVTTIAPTGTISIIADCSSGIEPVFALAYLHKARGVGDAVRTLVIANKTFEEIARQEGFYSEDLAQKVMEHGSVSGVDEVPEVWQRIFRTAQEIDPDWHVKMQAAFQKYTDNGVSKTINLPNSATIDDVKRAYLLSWETGCKGITVYRDGCKAVQVLNVSSTLKTRSNGNETAKVVEDSISEPIEVRPMVLHGKTYKVLTPVGEAFVTINHDTNSLPLEVFVTVGKGGMHVTADAEALGRMISLTLKASRGARRREIAQKIVSQLRGIGGASQIGFGKDRVMSLADAIAKVLAEELALIESDSQDQVQPEHLLLNLTVENHQENVTMVANGKVAADLCPECGLATFIREDGCQKCYSCGYSKC